MKVVFYLTDQGLTSYNDSNNTTEFFKWEDIESIYTYFAEVPEKTTVSIVVDVMDEDIYFEWAPKVFPWEKKSIISRRKERVKSDDFALTEVLWTNYQNVTENGRKEELILTATVANTFNLQGFLDSVEEAQILVTEIYSKPFLLVEYFKKRVKLHLKYTKQALNAPFLMVTRQSDRAFRQTFFYEGQVRISRLVEIDSDLSDMTTALINETRLAIAYANSQNIMPIDTPVGLIFLDGDQAFLSGLLEPCQKENLVPPTWQEGDFEFKTITFDELSVTNIHCNSELESCFSQQAMVDFIFNAKPAGFYFNSYIEKIKNLILGRHVFVGVNVLLLLGGLYYVLITGVDTLVSWEKQVILEQKIAEHQTEVTRLKEIVKLQDDAQQVKASVEFSEAILSLKLDRLISFDINALSDVFSRHANIQLSQMNWKTLDRFDSRKNQIELIAWVYPFYETYEKPVKWVDDFVKDLKTLKGIESVELEKEPLNRKLSQSLIINAKMGEVEALPFVVNVRIKDVESK